MSRKFIVLTPLRRYDGLTGSTTLGREKKVSTMDRPDAPFWNLPSEALLSQMEALPSGLSQQEAHARAARFGSNTLRNYGERPLIIQ